MFNLRKIINCNSSAALTLRCLSSSQVKPLVDISVDDGGIATIQLQRPPVNSLNLELIHRMRDLINEAEKNKYKGIILSSAFASIFSAGVDLMELYKPDVKRLEVYKHTLLDVVIKLFGTNLITSVAINGYGGAAACVLALSCDYRTMTTGKATIGLNDTAVGIQPGQWLVDLMTRVMGVRHAEYALISSSMFSAERALQMGLIDEVAADKADAVQKCKDFIKMYDDIPPSVRASTKRLIRQEYITQFEKNRKEHVNNFVDIITTPVFQARVEHYIQSLKQKKSR